jgi:putative endonuclease
VIEVGGDDARVVRSGPVRRGRCGNYWLAPPSNPDSPSCETWGVRGAATRGALSPSAGRLPAATNLRGMPEAWVYLLRCRDGSLYTGWTVDLERRLARHRAGTASRYTASRLPVELELAMAMPSRTAARREEARIKRLPRAAKLALRFTERSDSPVASVSDEGSRPAPLSGRAPSR